MTETVDAIYENGVFRPLKQPALSEGQAVQLIVTPRATSPDDLVELAGRVYDGLSEDQIDEVERIILHRGDFFGKAN